MRLALLALLCCWSVAATAQNDRFAAYEEHFERAISGLGEGWSAEWTDHGLITACATCPSQPIMTLAVQAFEARSDLELWWQTAENRRKFECARLLREQRGRCISFERRQARGPIAYLQSAETNDQVTLVKLAMPYGTWEGGELIQGALRYAAQTTPPENLLFWLRENMLRLTLYY